VPIDWSDEAKINGKAMVMRICKDCGERRYISKPKASDMSRCAPCARKDDRLSIRVR